MPKYSVAYRLGFTPWERYLSANAGTIEALFQREEADRPAPPGRAIDLGCGRGLYTAELAKRGWAVVGLDNVPEAIEAARRRVPGAEFLVGDVTDLESAGLGTFDLFLDVGCFQGLTGGQRLAEGRGVTALAAPGATLLMLTFGPTRIGSVVGGASGEAVEAAFPDWSVLSAEPAATAGLGWPLSRTAPRWYRLRRPG